MNDYHIVVENASSDLNHHHHFPIDSHQGNNQNSNNNQNNHQSNLNNEKKLFESPIFDRGFTEFLNSGEFSDLTIYSSGKRYDLHRVIVSHSSKYLADYFDSDDDSSTIINNQNNNQNNQSNQINQNNIRQRSNNFNTYFVKNTHKENNGQTTTTTYQLQGSFIEYFDNVINYMYKGQTNFNSLNALPLLSLSTTFQIKGLKKASTIFLTNSITKENAFYMLNRSIGIGSDDLINKCINVICKHFNQIIQPHFSTIFKTNQNNISTVEDIDNQNNQNNININIPMIDDRSPNDERETLDDDDDQQDEYGDQNNNNNNSSEQNNQNTITNSIVSNSITIPSSSNNNNNNNNGNSKIFGSPSPNSASYIHNVANNSNTASPVTSNNSNNNNSDKSLNPNTIHTIPELLSLPLDIMIKLMSQNNLSVSNEAIVYKTILKYIQANRENLSETDISTLFEIVRFPLFNYQQLEEVQENTLIPKHLITEALLLRLKIHEGPKDSSTINNSNNSTGIGSGLSNINFSLSSNNQHNANNIMGGGGNDSSFLSSSLPINSMANHSLISNSLNTLSSNSPLLFTMDQEQLSQQHQQQQSQQQDQNILMRKTPRAAFSISLEYKSNFDTGGLFYYIGTNGYKEEWSNPAHRGRVRVTCSSIEKGNVTECVGSQPNECWTMDVPASWIAVNLGSSRTMVPTYYSLRHGGNSKADCLRNWTLQGSMDSKNWTVLSRHSNDSTLSSNYSCGTWPIVDCSQAYRHFRILQTGRNSSNHNFLSISNIEFYGDLHIQTHQSVV